MRVIHVLCDGRSGCGGGGEGWEELARPEEHPRSRVGQSRVCRLRKGNVFQDDLCQIVRQRLTASEAID
ncbi:hypothetical protein J6590_031368 [Homalodisca vitripennis]|nr:hypothetical protein J6590_031368 [Homalodisca vitripennis]